MIIDANIHTLRRQNKPFYGGCENFLMRFSVTK